MRRFGVLGVPCFAGDLTTATRLVVDRARAGTGGYACLANVHVLVSAKHDPNLQDALDCAWTVFPDGAPVAWLQRKMGPLTADRISGADLMSLVCSRGVEAELRHFLLGSTNDVLRRLQEVLERAHPGVAIAGSYSPSRDQVEGGGGALAERVRAENAHIVWCAFGAPRQELWMARNAPALTDTLLVGVGAAFDFIAGTKTRAPLWMQRSGLEWAHRLGSEPRRLFGRYLRTNSEFIVRAAGEIASSRRFR